jgi:hypothetical protein
MSLAAPTVLASSSQIWTSFRCFKSSESPRQHD